MRRKKRKCGIRRDMGTWLGEVKLKNYVGTGCKSFCACSNVVASMMDSLSEIMSKNHKSNYVSCPSVFLPF